VKDLERSIEAALQDFGVPGLGVAVIAEQNLVLSRGFGVRALGLPDRVDENTRFAIGSVSKSFTATAIAMLVDEGKLGWDSRVTDHLGSFELFDPYVTRELTVRDLLVHRSGLERGDMMWYKSGYDRDEVLERVRHLQPSWGFRTTFGYQNVMYTAAGEVIRAVSGASWDAFVTSRLLLPLGMKRSSAHITLLDRSDNLAASHAEIAGSVCSVPPEEGTNSNAAGSIYSSAQDMVQWLRLHLSDGCIGDHRLLTSGSMAALHTPQMLIACAPPWTNLFPGASFLSYAMGWFVYSYRGHTVITHGGNIDGMSAAACIVPDLGFGVVALTNLDGSALAQAVIYHALDAALRGSSSVWFNEFLESERVTKKRMAFARAEHERERIQGTTPSRPLSAFAGTYADAFYGTAAVTYSEQGLHLDFIGWTGPLEHYHLDVFSLDPDKAILKKYEPVVRFGLDDYGKPATLTMRLLGGVRMELARKPDEPIGVALSLEEMQRLTGVYTAGAPRTRVRIEVLDGTLKATLPGSLTGAQAEYAVVTLIPTSPAELSIKGTGLTLEVQTERATLRIPHQQPIVLEREA